MAQGPQRDRVTLRSERSGGRTVIAGEIVDYTGERLLLRTRAGTAPRSYPADQVVSVETSQTAQHIEGLAALAEGRIEDATAAFEQALASETRAWVRRDILAALVRCALMRGDRLAAVPRFLALVESDPATRHFGLIPLVWTGPPPTPAEEAAARAWLSHELAPARLIGASLLLTDRRYGDLAQNELGKLAAAGHPHVHKLARVQLWRVRLAGQPLNHHELESWLAELNRLPKDLRGGAYYLLGQARLARSEYEPAAAALLRLPLVYDEDHSLAARAALEAADALKNAGQTSAAAAVYREVTSRFADTAYAAEADAALKLFATEPRASDSAAPEGTGR